MAIVEPVDEAALKVWAESRPPIVQALIRSHPPGRLYRIKTSGHRATLYAYDEDGTIKVHVTGKYNLVAFDRTVFGVKPEDLEECELPGPGEILGTALTEDEDVNALIAAYRVKAS